MPEQPSFLIATADDASAAALEAMLFETGARGRRVTSQAEALNALDQGSFDVLIADAALVDLPSAGLSRMLLERGHELPLIVLVDGEQPSNGAAAVRAGAADFLRKPVERDEVMYVLAKALQSAQPGGEEPPRSRVFTPSVQLIGRSEPMQDLERTLRRAADGIATVLVRGESGTGKELVARLVHEYSPRRAGPYVKVHCAALPDQLLESELFGYERGAFNRRDPHASPAASKLAEGGTLFLDEIGDISPATQVKLLRVLQDRRYERLGGTETLSADVRFVTATHRDLEALVREGKFREDLFYRLNVVALWVPPLRARQADIETLALHFCTSVAAANGRRAPAFDADALSLLAAESWPGNVRQLQNVVERLVVLGSGPRIGAADVSRELRQKPGALAFAESSGFAPQSRPRPNRPRTRTSAAQSRTPARSSAP